VEELMVWTASNAVYVTGFVIGSIVRGFFTRRYRRRKPGDVRSGTADGLLLGLASIGMAMPIIFLATSWLDFADYYLPLWGDRVTVAAGGVIFAAAIVLLWRSHADLGRNWSFRLETQADQTLVTQGVYGRIRHPMYAAHLLWGIGQMILVHNWVAGPAFLLGFVPLYLYRAPQEERMMLEIFRNDYQNYMERTGGILPKRRDKPSREPKSSP